MVIFSIANAYSCVVMERVHIRYANRRIILADFVDQGVVIHRWHRSRNRQWLLFCILNGLDLEMAPTTPAETIHSMAKISNGRIKLMGQRRFSFEELLITVAIIALSIIVPTYQPTSSF